jgi:hypothetical protein
MRALATRSRLAVGFAVLTAAALGTVSASAAQASGTSTAPSATLSAPASTTPSAPSGGTARAIAYHPTANAPDDVNAANDDFAACMREQGQKYFPDFHATKDDEGHVGLRVKLIGGNGFDPTSDAYQDALDACAPILNKVGITFPDPADLPPLPAPGKPGEPGKPGQAPPSLHTEKGGKEKGGTRKSGSGDGLPGLTTSVKTA